MLKSKLKKAYLELLFRRPHNRIYSFHRVCDDPLEKQLTGRGLDEKAFREFVLSHGPYVPLADLCARQKMDHTAALTFDDGLQDVYTVVYPFLKEHGIPFTAFVLTGKLDQPGYLTTEQLSQLARDPLVTIGSHGISHLHLSRESAERQKEELEQSRQTLRELLGRPCRYFAYPFGDYDETTLQLVKEAGYELAFAVAGRPILKPGQGAPFTIPRLSIADETLDFYRNS